MAAESLSLNIVDDNALVAAELVQAREQLGDILSRGTPENTRRAYESDWRYVTRWHELRLMTEAEPPLSADTVLLFISDHLQGLPERVEDALVSAGRKRPGVWKVASLSRRLAALSAVHKAFEVDDPTDSLMVKAAMKAARRMRTDDGRPDQRSLVGQKAALVKSDVLAMLATTTRNPVVDARDRALIAVAFWSGGRRRSELVQATMTDLCQVEDGYTLTLPVTKTTSGNDVPIVPIFGKAAVALEAWLAMVGSAEGPIFRSITQQREILPAPLRGEDVRRIVRRRAKLAGIDVARVSAHSLRSGFVNEAARQGVAMLDTMALTTHRSVETLRRYYRPAELSANPAARL